MEIAVYWDFFWALVFGTSAYGSIVGSVIVHKGLSGLIWGLPVGFLMSAGSLTFMLSAVLRGVAS